MRTYRIEPKTLAFVTVSNFINVSCPSKSVSRAKVNVNKNQIVYMNRLHFWTYSKNNLFWINLPNLNLIVRQNDWTLGFKCQSTSRQANTKM